MEVLNTLFGTPANSVNEQIIWYIRLPKAITAILAGAAMSVSGLQMQTLFRNPLAGPSVLGITSGASLGVGAVMLLSGGSVGLAAIQKVGISGAWLVIGASIAGSGAIMLLLLMIASRLRDNIVLLVVGMMLGNLTIALVSVWQYLSEPERIQDYLMWTFGSIGGVTSEQLPFLAGSIALGLLLALWMANSMNVMLLGERYAGSMGVKVKQLRAGMILSSSLLAGAVTGFCGPIGFVGIAVPHLSREWTSEGNHKVLLPSVILIGATVLLCCDILAQWAGDGMALPINVVTALIGSPVVVWVIVRGNKIKRAF
ncbi:iron ABC transporter permease [Algivirga pacifica]|uniref:Iron ABC transporter permease n=2 Tax=Algivirga pacifica TaxID=1162670 RepID=A0ABP9DHN5_9BACT